VVEASARRNEEFLIKTLDTDEGARRLGELGIGCNPGIQHHMKNVLYDEKIYGTVHLAVGNGFPFLGGNNVSNVHWDMVKDLRQGGQIFCDGELVQENGAWLF
jgi:aminopeptidase